MDKQYVWLVYLNNGLPSWDMDSDFTVFEVCATEALAHECGKQLVDSKTEEFRGRWASDYEYYIECHLVRLS